MTLVIIAIYDSRMLSKTDKKYLSEHFATKDDLKRFATKDDLPSAIRKELNAQKPELVREITESVTSSLSAKIDLMYEKLDSFIGEIKARREEDTLHTKTREEINDRLNTIEHKLDIAN